MLPGACPIANTLTSPSVSLIKPTNKAINSSRVIASLKASQIYTNLKKNALPKNNNLTSVKYFATLYLTLQDLS